MLKAENQTDYVVPKATRLARFEYLGKLFNPENSDWTLRQEAKIDYYPLAKVKSQEKF